MLTMALARLAGDAVVNWFGAVRTVRAGGGLAVLGGLPVVVADHPAVAMSGFALMGLGIAVVVPLCFAAAGHRPISSGHRGRRHHHLSGPAPSAIGTLAQATSLVVLFGLVTVLACGLAAFAGAARG